MTRLVTLAVAEEEEEDTEHAAEVVASLGDDGELDQGESSIPLSELGL